VNDANAGQQNSDTAIGNGASIVGHDSTVPNAIGDGVGDACETDADIDGDGLLNGGDADAGGDVTYDDDGDGRPACLNSDLDADCTDAGEVRCLGGSYSSATSHDTDGSDDGPSWDTNCDGVRDGVTPLGSGDSDGDGLSNGEETRRWGTCPDTSAIVGLVDCSTVADAQDSDADGKGDCAEAYDSNGDGAVLFPSDGVNAVRAALLGSGTGPGTFGKDGDFDVNGDNAILFPTDGLNGVKAALLPAFCTP
jgi:hypothetical protein